MTFSHVPFDNALVASWAVALRAERKSPSTIVTYLEGVNQYAQWCVDHGHPVALEAQTFREYLVWLSETRGYEANTVATRHVAVRRFSKWLAEEEGYGDHLASVKGPVLDQKIVMPLSSAQLQALFAACRGPEFGDRRDEAMARLLAESGARATEMLQILLSDTDIAAGTTVIRRGKGGRGRIIPFGAQTARALDRYLRARRTHPLAATDLLWLGNRGRGFKYSAMYKALGARAEAAGIEDFHPHRMRHTFADRWLEHGGTEGGLMAVAGWTRSDMIRRYARGREAARAMDESRRLNLGDL